MGSGRDGMAGMAEYAKATPAGSCSTKAAGSLCSSWFCRIAPPMVMPQTCHERMSATCYGRFVLIEALTAANCRRYAKNDSAYALSLTSSGANTGKYVPAYTMPAPRVTRAEKVSE